jgi:hypothetical protein
VRLALFTAVDSIAFQVGFVDEAHCCVEMFEINTNEEGKD